MRLTRASLSITARNNLVDYQVELLDFDQRESQYMPALRISLIGAALLLHAYIENRNSRIRGVRS